MDVSIFKTEKITISIHLFTTDEIDEWKQKTGGEVAALSNCVCLRFNIGEVEVKLFSSSDPAPEDGTNSSRPNPIE